MSNEVVDNNLEEAKLAFIADYIDRFVMPNMLDEEEARKALEFFKTSNFSVHYLRFLETYDRIIRLVDLKGKRVAETGHLSGISCYLKENGINVDRFDGDFRYELKAPSSAYDVLFSFEVLEHLKDQDPKNMDECVLWNFSGARAFFREMHRVLDDDGILILTTPNAASLYTTCRCLRGEPPWLFHPHVREFTIGQVADLAAEVGFKLIHVDTMYVCFFFEDRQPHLKKYFADLGFSTDNRGDDAFFLFRKRMSSPAPIHTPWELKGLSQTGGDAPELPKTIERETIPKNHEGVFYMHLMSQLSVKRNVKTYLEIGVDMGGLLAHIHAETAVAVDPAFRINSNIAANKKCVVLYNMTSDAFFADETAVGSIGSSVDLAFLDGLHAFEFLLRDFYNTEALCNRRSLIVMHDCLPLTTAMTHRNKGIALELGRSTDFPHAWTGDVWKIILILRKYRPDLNLVFADNNPTGLLFVTGLSPGSQVLSSNYLKIVNEFKDVPSDLAQLEEMYKSIEIVSSSEILNGLDHSLYLRNVRPRLAMQGFDE